MAKVRLLEGASYEESKQIQDCEFETVPRIGEQIAIRSADGAETYSVEMVEHRLAGPDSESLIYVLMRNTGFFTPIAPAGR